MISIGASVERAWQLWADPRQLERWGGAPTYPATVVDHDAAPYLVFPAAAAAAGGTKRREGGKVLRLSRPSPRVLDRLVAQQRAAIPSYPGLRGTLRREVPPGFRHDHYEIGLGSGEVWRGAVEALKDWAPQRGSGLAVAADGPVAEGTTVALAAPLPLGWAVAVCRVVAVIDEPARFGFAYGSLPVHPEEGEELFLLDRSHDVVRFEITSFSRPRHPLVRLGAPVARRLQVRTTRRYLTAMSEAATRSGA